MNVFYTNMSFIPATGRSCNYISNLTTKSLKEKRQKLELYGVEKWDKVSQENIIVTNWKCNALHESSLA